MPRSATIDAVKGVLIMLVIVGHIFVDPLNGNIIKWGIYSFHMPLFLGLSGVLFSVERVKTSSYGEFIKTSASRYLIPWALAFCIFTTLRFVIGKNELTGLTFLHELLYPWNHLWYIPVFFLFSMCVKIFRASRLALFVGALTVSILFELTVANPAWVDANVVDVYWLGDKRLYTYSVYFFLGILVSFRSGDKFLLLSDSVLRMCRLGVWVGFIGCLAAFCDSSRSVYVQSKLLLNCSLIVLLPSFLTKCQIFWPFLNNIGKHSLFYYLWHPAIIEVANRIGYGPVPGSVAFVITLLLTLLSMRFLVLVLANTKIAQIVGIEPAITRR